MTFIGSENIYILLGLVVILIISWNTVSLLIIKIPRIHFDINETRTTSIIISFGLWSICNPLQIKMNIIIMIIVIIIVLIRSTTIKYVG